MYPLDMDQFSNFLLPTNAFEFQIDGFFDLVVAQSNDFVYSFGYVHELRFSG